MIIVTYTSVDFYRKRSSFKTLAGARKFAQKWLGEFPSVGTGYAISDDGIGKITVSGASLADLFPSMAGAGRDFECGAASVEAYNDSLDEAGERAWQDAAERDTATSGLPPGFDDCPF